MYSVYDAHYVHPVSGSDQSTTGKIQAMQGSNSQKYEMMSNVEMYVGQDNHTVRRQPKGSQKVAGCIVGVWSPWITDFLSVLM